MALIWRQYKSSSSFGCPVFNASLAVTLFTALGYFQGKVIAYAAQTHAHIVAGISLSEIHRKKLLSPAFRSLFES